MKNTFIGVALIALVVGISVGYLVAGSRVDQRNPETNSPGTHVMPDGSVMGNDGQRMDMADMMASMNDELRGKTGDEFDKAFISEMIVHHEGAVEMAELARTNAKHQEIKDLADAIISAQNKEIEDMRAWQKSWYGN